MKKRVDKWGFPEEMLKAYASLDGGPSIANNE